LLPLEPTRIRISPVDFAVSSVGHRGTVRSAGTLRGVSDRHGQWGSPRTVGAFVSSARGAVISTSGVAAARDPHPPGGRDRDEDRDGPSGFGSMATLRRFVRQGI